MKRFTLQHTLTIVMCSMAMALPAAAERILYIDAAMPGNDPTNTWVDLSASGYDFANHPSFSAEYNAANLSYDFEVGHSMCGTGDESLFDFETAWETGNEGPTGTNATPFSIVAYVNQDHAFAAGNYDIISKTDQPGTGQFQGWIFAGNSDQGNRFDFSMQPGNNADRLYRRIEDGYSGAPILLTLTYDGSGDAGGALWYVNGAESTQYGHVEDTLFGSIRNDFPLVLGFNGAGGALEIHDVVLTPEEIADRWNTGDVARAGQPSRVIPSSSVAASNLIAISFDSISGFDYEIQETADLPGDTWTVTATVSGNGGVVTKRIAQDGSSEKIYRIVWNVGI